VGRYTLARPVEAIRYVKHNNEGEIAELVKSTGRRMSFSNASGRLHFYNDGPDLLFEDGDWAVLIASAVVAVPTGAFESLFAPVEV
jgi:hypothetical protein